MKATEQYSCGAVYYAVQVGSNLFGPLDETTENRNITIQVKAIE